MMRQFERLLHAALNAVSMDNNIVDVQNQGHGAVAVRVEVDNDAVLHHPIIVVCSGTPVVPSSHAVLGCTVCFPQRHFEALRGSE